MDVELQKQLIDKYPEQFQVVKYIGCGNGWYNLLDKGCYLIQNRLEYLKKIGQPLSFAWTQIKEKFGGLRVYNYGSDEYIKGVVDTIESLSYNVCEVSGQKGQLRTKKLVDGEPVMAWIKTLSDNEALKEGYILEKHTTI
jgi:hypothetical protein